MSQDYIMRLVQQIAAMLAAIVAKRRSGQIAEARQLLDETFAQAIGLSLQGLRRMPPEAVAEHLQASGGNRHPRAVMAAELLIQDAEMREEQDAPQQALASYIHAFCLLFDSVEFLSPEEQAIYRPKLAMLAAKLEQLPPNQYTTDKLAAHRAAANS